MKTLILDTSSILFGMSNNIDIFGIARYEFPGHEIMVSEGVVSELKTFAGSKRKEHSYARIALEMLYKNDINVYKDKGKVDEWIVGHAKRINALVCTNDIELKKRLKEQGIRALSVSRDGKMK